MEFAGNCQGKPVLFRRSIDYVLRRGDEPYSVFVVDVQVMTPSDDKGIRAYMGTNEKPYTKPS